MARSCISDDSTKGNTMMARTGCAGSAGSREVEAAAWAALLATAAALALATPAALDAQDDCRFSGVIELAAPATSELQVDAGAGSLTVRGAEGATEFRATATLCASDERRLEGLGATLRGGRLDTTYPSRRSGLFSWAGNRYARIDLEVEVPAGTNLRVEDGSGVVRISGVGDVDLEDGAGAIHIEDVGSLAIDDGSGDIRIAGVAGDVRLDDNSGSLAVEAVGGDVVIEDGSGLLRVSDVSGSVTVTDGSGSIRIEAVGGSVRLDDIGSGIVTVRDVDGDLVAKDGPRNRIRHSDVRGTVDLPPARRGGG